MKVSIIIVTYNTKQMTAECIDSIFEKTRNVDFEVILVDNASSDGSKDLFESDSRLTYVYSNENLGFGKANNLGYKYACGKYIFLLNSDTLLINNAVYEMFSFMESVETTIGCCGCVLQDKNGRPNASYNKNFPTLRWIFQENLSYAIPKSSFFWNPYKRRDARMKLDRYPLYVNHISGADLFIRREVVEKCGLFDPDFFMYYEETEMQYRFCKKGYKSVVIDSPKIVHLYGASSSKKFSLKKFNVNLKSRYLYAQKTFSPIKQIVFRLIHLLILPRLLLSVNPWNEKKESLRIILH